VAAPVSSLKSLTTEMHLNYIVYTIQFTENKLRLPYNNQYGNTVSEVISVMSVTKNSVGKCWNVKSKGTYSCSYHRDLNIKPKGTGILSATPTNMKEERKNIRHSPLQNTNRYLRHCCSERSVGKLSWGVDS